MIGTHASTSAAFAVILVLGCTVTFGAADTSDLDQQFNQLKSGAGSLANSLPAGILPPNFNESAIPSADDIVKLLRQKCEKNAGNADEWPKVEEAGNTFRTCISDLVDVETLQEEIEKAQPNGELDTVFNKYCRKRTTAIDCMKNLTAAIEPCLSTEEQTHKKTFVNIFTNVLNFVCHKDGDQIALFIAEKGPDCLSSKKDELTRCANATFGSYVVSNVTLDTLPQLVVGPKECGELSSLQRCVVKELERCEESTPANLVDAMFKFIRNETPCVHLTPPSRQTSQRSAAEPRARLSTTAAAAAIGAVGAMAVLVSSRM